MQAEFIAQIEPFWVGMDNQCVLLFTPPFLNFPLTSHRRMDISGFLKVDKFVYVVLLGEPPYGMSSVLMESSHEIVCHADIHDPVVPVGENIDEVLVLPHHETLTLRRTHSVSLCVISTNGRNLFGFLNFKISRFARNDKEDGRNDSMVIAPHQSRLVLSGTTGLSSGVLLPKFSHHGIGINQFDLPTFHLL